MKDYAVYILANRHNTVLYTGVTNNLERRVIEHKSRQVPGFTRNYNCDRLVYYEQCGTVEDAIAREKQIKGWRRGKKDGLITRFNPEWQDLAAFEGAMDGDFSPSDEWSK